MHAMAHSDRPRATTRRSFLYATTATVGAVGLAAATWPFIDQMNPDAQVRAAGDLQEVDLTPLKPGAQLMRRWHNVPVFIVRRTAAMLAAMQAPAFVVTLVDPDSQKRQQPSYARNWHRSIDPDVAVLVGVCTRCSCVPAFVVEALADDIAGGYVCPCCASRYDPAGRAFAGPAQYNLPVPPYARLGPTRIMLGQPSPREPFTLESLEQL
jgi:ubiquinol-cytochrome c reductase iron-sulfur subunit